MSAITFNTTTINSDEIVQEYKGETMDFKLYLLPNSLPDFNQIVVPYGSKMHRHLQYKRYI